ncbi:hypothetical protein [Undibacterium pigrum]|nr:hypothetical protein [Undibacterium pigrum]
MKAVNTPAPLGLSSTKTMSYEGSLDKEVVPVFFNNSLTMES